MDFVIALVLVQGAIGAFDVVYHHELTERLPWRQTARHELLLHATRNALYVIVYLCLGWYECRGVFAWVLCGVLVVEVFLTFRDFVVEDRTRRLPATERVTHAVLTLNYGIILALFVPEIAAWAVKPTALAPVDRGLWTWFIAPCLAGVAFWSVRDLAATARFARLPVAPVDIADLLPGHQEVLVTGATGFIGTHLCRALAAAGHGVTVVTRDRAKAAARIPGPLTLIDTIDQLGPDAGFDAVVNLAGEPVATGRWTRERRRRIVRSRLDTTRSIVAFIARARRKPRVLISASAIGYYGDGTMDGGEPGPRNFSQRLCGAWEACARRAADFGVRVNALRIGIVLGTDGGALAQMLPMFDLGLGGRMGDGRQIMSWIHIGDVVRLIAFAIATDGLRGPVNATAPVPVTGSEFATTLARVLRRPALLHIPAWTIRLAMGQMADEVLLSGRTVLPRKAQGAGFRFRHTTLESGLAALLGQVGRKDSATWPARSFGAPP